MKMLDVVIVADNFFPSFTGGAELTTYALTSHAPSAVRTSFILSSHLNYFHIAMHRSKFWIFTNIEKASLPVIKNAAEALKNYVCVEYDYKFCIHRSPDKHKHIEGKDCNCNIPEINTLLQNAKHLFFMSGKQRDAFAKRLNIAEKSSVLSSCFTNNEINDLINVRKNRNKSADTWMILHSESWVKGTEQALRYAVKEGIKYQLVQATDHKNFIDMFGKFKGLIYMPAGADTCPRIVIEAKLAGCELILNDNVLHRDEEWFSGPMEAMEIYLRNVKDTFWDEAIKNDERKSNLFMQCMR